MIWENRESQGGRGDLVYQEMRDQRGTTEQQVIPERKVLQENRSVL